MVSRNMVLKCISAGFKLKKNDADPTCKRFWLWENSKVQ